MSQPRRLLLAASLAAPLALSSCVKKANNDETQPPLTTVPAQAANPPAKVVAEPRPAAERITVSGSVEGLDDIFAAFKKFSESYMPDQAVDPLAEIQAGLLGMGFGPGFWGNLDLAGVHAFTMASPVSGGGPQDNSLAASVAVIDARKLIENMPQAQRPAPLGDGMWELAIDTTRLLLREQGHELLLGFSTGDIDAASKLRGQTGPGPRIRLRATNIPTDDIDPSAVLDELPSGSKLARELSAILKELDAVTLSTDVGTTRDFQLQVGATAPFHRLGLEPIGKPRAAATKLEGALPADPVFVTTLSWGDPALLHAMVDSAPVSQVPDPVRPMVEKALESAHGLLDQIAQDVVFALYLDAKGQATIVLAADVSDDAKAKKALQGLHEVLAEGAETQATMAGKNKDAALGVKLELDGMTVPGGKADALTITIPKDLREDAREARMFLRKDKLEAVSNVAGGIAVLAIGAGARAIVTDVAKSTGKPRKRSLADSAGLQGLRTSMGGCQICMAGDPLAYFRFRLMLVRDETDDKAIIKRVGEQIYQLSKLGSIGQPGAGIKVEAEAAAVGVMVPQQTLYAPVATVQKLGEINDFLDDPESSLAEEPAAKKKEEAKG